MTEVEQLKERIRVLRRYISAHAQIAGEIARYDLALTRDHILNDVEDIKSGLEEALREDDHQALLAQVLT